MFGHIHIAVGCRAVEVEQVFGAAGIRLLVESPIEVTHRIIIAFGNPLEEDLSRVRVFVSGDNIFEWSALKKYFDPEAVTDESNYGYVYPFNRQYSFGVNVTF